VLEAGRLIVCDGRMIRKVGFCPTNFSRREYHDGSFIKIPNRIRLWRERREGDDIAHDSNSPAANKTPRR